MKIVSPHLLIIASIVILTASSCEDDDPFTTSPEELAEQIRRNTPTELPPITTTGENTMGAWIHPQQGSPLHDLAGTDSILFVASGVDRPETALATSLDCDAFNNIKKLSTGNISAVGIHCPRKEIGDPRYMSLSFLHILPDSTGVSFRYQSDWFNDSFVYSSRRNHFSIIDDVILLNDSTSRVLSAVFDATLVNHESPFDTVRITVGRFDVIYGTTP